MSRNLEIIDIITKDNNFKHICKVISKYPEDVYQESLIVILELKEHKLPPNKDLNLWYYCLVCNLSSPSGKVGRMFADRPVEIREWDTNELVKERMLRQAEEILIGLTDFERKVFHLYIKYNNLSKVQRELGLGYSVLRHVIKKIRSKVK